jgi:hypothetical protein
MKNRNGSVRSVQALAPAELLFLIGLLIPGSAALSQPFPSFMLDSTIVRGPSLSSVGRTSVAYGPDIGLVTWVSNRLFCARIDRTGTLRDTVPIDIRDASAEGSVWMRPGVAWGDGRFLVAWTELGTSRAACALIDSSGQVVWRHVLQESVDVMQNCNAPVAYDGTNFLAAWIAQNEADSFTAFFSRISPDGVMLDSPPREVAPRSTLQQYDMDLCYHGGRFLAVWNNFDTTGLWASWILPDGTVPDSVGFPISVGIPVDFPSVTHDSRNYVVSWYEFHNKTKLARVTDNGQVLDASGVVVDTNSHWENDVCSIGDTTLVVYFSDPIWGFDSLRAMAVLVDTALHIVSAPFALAWPSDGHVGGNGPGYLSSAAVGDSFIAAWSQPSQDTSGLAGCVAWTRRLDREGRLLDTAPVLVSYGPNRQEYADVASDGTDFLAVWVDTRYDTASFIRTVLARRFSASGSDLDSQPLRVGGTLALRPAVASSGDCYLVVWYENRETYGARISTTGALLDSVPLMFAEPGTPRAFPDVACGDSTFLIIWPTSAQSIHGVRMTPAGVVLDSVPLLLQADSFTQAGYPRVAFDGTNFLVARHDAQPSPDEFRCVRVTPAGLLLDTADVNIATSGDGAWRPNLAFGSGTYLAVDSRTGYSYRVSPDGSVLGPVPHSYLGYAEVVYDGTDFMLLCDMRDSSGSTTNQLGGLRITPGGRVLDAEPFALMVADSARVGASDAAMAANATGQVAAVAKSYEPAPYRSYRIRAVTFPAIVGIGSQREVGQPVAFRVQPNPASRTASLSFSLGQAGLVQVTAFDAAGRRCASLFSGRIKAGTQTLPLDTRRLANGVYFLRLEAGTTRHSTRLVVSR